MLGRFEFMENFFIKTFFILIGFGFFAAAGEMAQGMNFDSAASSLIPASVDTETVSENNLSQIDAALREAVRFPQEPDWAITLEQVAEFDFIKKGGSGVFYYYLQAWFNMAKYAIGLVDSSRKKSWERFCYLKNCSTGLDPNKINEADMRFIVKKLSIFSSMNLFPDETTGGGTESVVFLQGFPAPVGSDPWLEKDNEIKPSPRHIRDMLEQLERMRQRGVKKIAVNLPPQIHNDPWPFIYLGEFIKEQGIDLYIVGGCGHYCAIYLLPAAKTVHIEPYGYVYHKGNATGLLIGTSKVAKKQKEDLRKRLKEQRLADLTYKDKCEIAVASIISFSKSSLKIIGEFLVETGRKRMGEFVDKYEAMRRKMRSAPIAYWTEETVRTFIQSLSPGLLEDVALSLLESYNDEAVARRDYIDRLADMSKLELEYYLNIGAIELMELDYYLNTESNELISPHSYMGFLMNFSSILRDSEYAKYFTVPKHGFNITERDKPYKWIVPSAELLRGFGMDVRGENNKEMIDFSDFSDFSFILGINIEEYFKGSFLYLSSAAITDCGFLEEEVDLSKRKLERCFFDN